MSRGSRACPHPHPRLHCGLGTSSSSLSGLSQLPGPGLHTGQGFQDSVPPAAPSLGDTMLFRGPCAGKHTRASRAPRKTPSLDSAGLPLPNHLILTNPPQEQAPVIPCRPAPKENPGDRRQSTNIGRMNECSNALMAFLPAPLESLSGNFYNFIMNTFGSNGICITVSRNPRMPLHIKYPEK